MDKLERILEIVRTWQHGFHWRALQHALEDGKRDDLPDEQRTLDHLLFRSWSKQSNEVREYLRENAPRLLKLMPPVDWGNDLLRYDPDGLTREMVELEGELLEMRADPEKPAATEPAKLNATTTPPSGTEGDDTLSNLPDDAMMNHRDLAAALKLEAEPLRKRLDRWRSKNGDGWQELTEATAKEPRYLYHVAAVRAVLREAIKAK